MAHMGRPGLSTVQKADLWQRWKQRQSLSEIGRALGKHAGSIQARCPRTGDSFLPLASGRASFTITPAAYPSPARRRRPLP